MIKHLNILNLCLLAGIFLLLLSLYQGYSEISTINIKDIDIPEDSTPKKSGKIDKIKTNSIPQIENIPEYSIINEKNLFHPERKAIEPKSLKELDEIRPDLILYGTMITDGIRIAFVENKKAPYKTPGRGKRQKALRVGDEIAGYRVAEITENSVVIVANGERYVYRVEDSFHEKRKGASKKAKPQAKPGQRRPVKKQNPL